ncbi:hypothetical protein [Clostridium perfringens]|jgi:hypothetical protein|uniref:Uncharacterized protein n=1 Tax=Clostridium perfringens TaxID=1502 RepID=A0AAW4J3K9_CLOPF|nr:hypothetical protein [Clostridium perfringens]MBO3356124.1 hypothetical protein [Clostridium perfringens]MBO3359535.1 hypothetical protein [Clostridium perfringens]
MKICGIHTRLQNIIDKSGGYNVFAATEKLMEDYNIKDFFTAYYMAKDENIRNKIKSVGLKNVIKSTEESIKIQDIEFSNLMRMF